MERLEHETDHVAADAGELRFAELGYLLSGDLVRASSRPV